MASLRQSPYPAGSIFGFCFHILVIPTNCKLFKNNKKMLLTSNDPLRYASAEFRIGSSVNKRGPIADILIGSPNDPVNGTPPAGLELLVAD